ncbi:protoporphyrinogen/coproporphyrinogen oxidase [Streptomyces sp. YIM S03343]
MKKVVVVGGGSSGLSAAFTLKKSGYDVTLLDRDKKPGGRLKMYQQDGFSINIATQLFVPSYTVAHQLIDEVGLTDQVLPVDMSLMRTYFDNGWVNSKPDPSDAVELAKAGAFAGSMGPNLPRFFEWIARQGAGMYEGNTDWLADLDGEDSGNFEDFVRNNFGEEVLENLVQPIIATIGLTVPADLGIAAGAMWVKSVMGGQCEVLTHGVGDLGTKLVEHLGDSVVADTPAREITVKNGRATGVETDKGFYEADAVICATQGNKVLGLIPGLSDAQKHAISKVTYCRCMHSMLFYDEVLSDRMMGGMMPRRTGAPFCGLLFNSRYGSAALPPGKECVSLFYYGEGNDRYWNSSEDEIAEVSAREFRKFFPELPKHFSSAKTIKIEEGNYTMHPGAATAMKQLRERHYQDVKGLYLCGDYLYTGSCESALNSGRRAAEVVQGLRETI